MERILRFMCDTCTCENMSLADIKLQMIHNLYSVRASGRLTQVGLLLAPTYMFAEMLIWGA